MSSAQDETPPPRPFEHCILVFETMRKQAKPTKIEGQHALVYEGYLTRLFSELQMATPYYTSIMRRLKAMGCVRQISRGGGSTPSRWELIREPTWELFEPIEADRLKDNTRVGQLSDMVSALSRRLGEAEDKIEYLLARDEESTSGEEDLVRSP